MIELDTVYNEDCLEGMKRIPDGMVDCIICDLPYGTTRNAWDSVIPLDKLWEQYRRVIKRNGAIVLFSQQPFTSILVSSNLEQYRYEWIWQKEQGTGFLNAKKMPMKEHENICVFYDGLPTYNPQMKHGYEPYGGVTHCNTTSNYGKHGEVVKDNHGDRYPTTILQYHRERGQHPTQKPVELIAYLIRTYTNEGETILDNTIGSGTTAVAALREKRHFIGFELNKEYFDIACKRIKAEQKQHNNH